MVDRLIRICDVKHEDELLGERRTFGLDGIEYEVDLCEEDMVEFDQAFAAYTQAARRVGRVSRGRRNTQDAGLNEPTQAEVRAWATTNGHEVSDRGRVPREVREAYDAAHGWSPVR